MSTCTPDPYRAQRETYAQWLADPANAAAEGRANIQRALDRLPPAASGSAAGAAQPEGRCAASGEAARCVTAGHPLAAVAPAVDPIAASWERAFAMSWGGPELEIVTTAAHHQSAMSGKAPCGWDRAFARGGDERR